MSPGTWICSVANINPLSTDHTPVCDTGITYPGDITVHVVPRKKSSIFTSNSKTIASELLKNLEEMPPRSCSRS